jgi:hypothetical protein
VLGFFASSTNVATFADPHGPGGERVFVLGAPLPLRAPMPEEAAV